MDTIVTYNFYHDPGHGWLQVPLQEIEELGIGPDISAYSYMAGEYAYLEEDRDAGIFIAALEKGGRSIQTVGIYIEDDMVRRMRDFHWHEVPHA